MPAPPLHAIRVLDLSRYVAGPVCAMQLAACAAAGLPAGAVRTVSEAAESPEIAERGMVAAVAHPTAGTLRLVASPHKLSDTPSAAPTPPPLLGEHDEEILRGLLGYGDARIEELRGSGTIR